MEPNNNQNNQQPPVVTNEPANPPAVAPVAAQDSSNAISQDISHLKSFVNKLKQGIKEKQELAKQNKSTDPASPDNNKKDFKTFFAKNKLIILALSVFLFFTILLAVASVYKALTTEKTVADNPTPTPEAVITATPSGIIVPSRYATDSAVLELESKINELDKNLSGTDIKETQLTPPQLDFEVKFK